jgi:hypothetical protein
MKLAAWRKVNVTMCEAMNEAGTWTTESIVDEGARLRITVTSCSKAGASAISTSTDKALRPDRRSQYVAIG